jgi:uncharacterized protein
MEWVWTEEKAAANYRKHRVRFETATKVFDDEHCVSGPDPHHDDDRWQTIGIAGQSTLFVVHTLIEDDGTARIISARLASRNERKRYEALRF